MVVLCDCFCLAVLDSQFPSGTFSGSKSWCSSPFSNLEEIHEDNSCNSLSFHLDFSPGVAFSSPRFKSDIMSPASGNKNRDISLFSPSIFSPFNKSMKNKGDTSKPLEIDFLDTYDVGSTNPSSAEKLTTVLYVIANNMHFSSYYNVGDRRLSRIGWMCSSCVFFPVFFKNS